MRRFLGKPNLYCLLPPYSQHLTERSSLILSGYPVSKSSRFRSVRRIGRSRKSGPEKRRTEVLPKPQVESAAPYWRGPSGLPIVPQRCGNENGPFRPCHCECAGTPYLDKFRSLELKGQAHSQTNNLFCFHFIDFESVKDFREM